MARAHSTARSPASPASHTADTRGTAGTPLKARAPLPAWPLPRMSALTAALGNALLNLTARAPQTLAGPLPGPLPGSLSCPLSWTLAYADLTASVRPLPFTQNLAASFIPACQGTLVWRGHVWLWALDTVAFARLHPALRGLDHNRFSQCELSEGKYSKDDPAPTLPVDVRLAALELLLEPLLRAAQGPLRDAVTLRDLQMLEKSVTPPSASPTAASSGSGTTEATILLEIVLDAGEGLREVGLCCLTPRHSEAGHALIHALPAAAKFRAHPHTAPLLQNLSVPVSILAGHIHLTVPEVATLALGDIILPDDVPAARGRALLCLPTAPPTGRGTPTARGCLHAFPCTLTSNTLTVDGSLVTLSPEHLMSQSIQNTAHIPENAQASTMAEGPASSVTDLLSVELRFELERRSMTVAEIGQLAPGSVLTLTADAASPVTLCAGDTVIGMGRLVDVEGALGVQITSLTTPHAS